MDDKPEALEFPDNFKLEELPADAPCAPADESCPIFKPFEGLMEFWPNDQWQRDDVSWVAPLEQSFLQPLGQQAARIFGVDLITDQEYIGVPEEIKGSHLFCVLTRARIQQTQLGIFEWYPICVVVRYCVMVAIQVRVQRASGQIEIPQCLLWSKDQQTYAPVFDEATGKIENPGVLLQVLDRYAHLEGLT